MHNGTFNTLEEVIDFYNHGGRLGLGVKVDNQTLPEIKFNDTGDVKPKDFFTQLNRYELDRVIRA